MTGRMRRGEWIVLLGMIALGLGSFLPWWDALDTSQLRQLAEGLESVAPDAEVESSGVSVSMTMWDLDVLPWLAMIAFVSAGCLMLATWFADLPRPAVIASVPTSWFGFWTAVATTIRVFNEPVPGAEVRYGIYVALAGATMLWLGGWDSMRDERVPAAMDQSPPPERITMEQLAAEAQAIKERRAT